MMSWNIFWHTTQGNISFIGLIVLILFLVLLLWFKVGKFLEQKLELPDRLIGVIGVVLFFGVGYVLVTALPPVLGRYGEVQSMYIFEDQGDDSITVFYKKHRRRGPKAIGAVHMKQHPAKTLHHTKWTLGTATTWHVSDGRLLVIHDPKQPRILDLRTFEHLSDIHDNIQTKVHGKTYKITNRTSTAIEVRTQDSKDHVFQYTELLSSPIKTTPFTTYLTPEAQCKLSTRTPYHYKRHFNNLFRVLKLNECGLTGTMYMHRSTPKGPAEIMIAWKPPKATKPKWTFNVTKHLGEAPDYELFPIRHDDKQTTFIVLKGRYGLFSLTLNTQSGAVEHTDTLL